MAEFSYRKGDCRLNTYGRLLSIKPVFFPKVVYFQVVHICSFIESKWFYKETTSNYA